MVVVGNWAARMRHQIRESRGHRAGQLQPRSRQGGRRRRPVGRWIPTPSLTQSSHKRLPTAERLDDALGLAPRRTKLGLGQHSGRAVRQRSPSPPFAGHACGRRSWGLRACPGIWERQGAHGLGDARGKAHQRLDDGRRERAPTGLTGRPRGESPRQPHSSAPACFTRRVMVQNPSELQTACKLALRASALHPQPSAKCSGCSTGRSLGCARA
jgi:hypothetical protein